jgi:hypothetical protein
MYTEGDATVCFTIGNESTAGGDCAALAVGAIEKATKTLLVRAYGFTEPAIIAAHRRGVDVTVTLDKSAPGEKGSGADPVHDAGISRSSSIVGR